MPKRGADEMVVVADIERVGEMGFVGIWVI